MARVSWEILFVVCDSLLVRAAAHFGRTILCLYFAPDPIRLQEEGRPQTRATTNMAPSVARTHISFSF